MELVEFEERRKRERIEQIRRLVSSNRSSTNLAKLLSEAKKSSQSPRKNGESKKLTDAQILQIQRNKREFLR